MEIKRVDKMTGGDKSRVFSNRQGLSPKELQFCVEVGKDELENETEWHAEKNRRKSNRACGYLILKNFWNRWRKSGLISLVKTKTENR